MIIVINTIYIKINKRGVNNVDSKKGMVIVLYQLKNQLMLYQKRLFKI